MLILQLEEVEVDYCERCRGVWLDAGELEALAGGTDPLLTALHTAPGVPPSNKYRCPRCDAAMAVITAPGMNVELERCPREHGLWFDSGELREILAHCSPADNIIGLLNDLFAYKKPQPQGG